MSINADAELLAQLHSSNQPLVLPTVWDAWSANVAVDAGFEALTIGSHPLADSRGAGDHEEQDFDEVIDAAKRIIDSVDVPVSVDLESGYGREPGEVIEGLIRAGGVGLNIEDTVHSEDGRLRSTEEHAAYIGGLRQAADDAGVPIWVNGRTDLFIPADDPADVVDEAIERMQALVDAGANSVYPVKIQDSDDILRTVVSAIDVPVNSTAHPVKHDLARFRDLGVGRITFGPLLQMALTDSMNEMLGDWR